MKKTLVETGIADDKMTEAVQGLHKGQLVVVEGLSFLVDGEQVEVISPRSNKKAP